MSAHSYIVIQLKDDNQRGGLIQQNLQCHLFDLNTKKHQSFNASAASFLEFEEDGAEPGQVKTRQVFCFCETSDFISMTNTLKYLDLTPKSSSY